MGCHKIISVTGISGSGKTTLIASSIHDLKKTGVRNIVVAKNVSRIDPPSFPANRSRLSLPPDRDTSGRLKDSDIFLSAGADVVAVISRKEGKMLLLDGKGGESRLVGISRSDDEEPLASILRKNIPDIEDASVIIAEGFSADETIPHIIIGSADKGKKISGRIIAEFPSEKMDFPHIDKTTRDTFAAYLYVFCALCAARPVFIGAGNTLRGDDGFGPSLATSLSEILTGLKNNDSEHSGILIIDAGVSPENYTGKILSFRPSAMVIFDAVSDLSAVAQDGRGRCGLKLYLPDEILQGAVKFSTHGGGLKMFLDYLKSEMGKNFPPTAVIGAPASSVSFGSGLSAPVAAEAGKLERFVSGSIEFLQRM